MKPIKSLSGRTFGRLTVTDTWERRRRPSDGRALIHWKCICACGNATIISASSLSVGDTTSCGCVKIGGEWRTRHGHATKGNRHPIYKIWCSMKDRCFNKNNKHWKDYGGRGIRVCDEWASNYEAFFAYIGDRPTPRHSIDRWPDVNGNYEPGNVRWATPQQQAQNQRKRTPHFKVFLEGVPLAKLAEARGLEPMTVLRRYRVGIRGELLFAPDLRKLRKKFNGTVERRT